MKALVIRQDEQGKSYTKFEDIIHEPEFIQGKVKIKVSYSSLNYKDALALTGEGKIIRQFPMIGGIDLVGQVEESPCAQFAKGDKVLLTGFGYGEQCYGAFAEYAYIEPQHLLHLPAELTDKQAMLIGTAGFTAMLCVNALLEANITPDKGEVVVTGATGGVGSAAVYLLSKLHYQVSAVSGKIERHEWLKELGAKKVYSRTDFEQTTRPLEKQQFAGVIDCVGGAILSNLLTKLDYNGCAVICGLAQSFKLDITVMPFILRNIRLQGVDSVQYPIEKREFVWQQMAHAFADDYFNLVGQEVALEQALSMSQELLKGNVTGRVAIKI